MDTNFFNQIQQLDSKGVLQINISKDIECNLAELYLTSFLYAAKEKKQKKAVACFKDNRLLVTPSFQLSIA